MIQLLIAATISFAFTIFVTPVAIRVFRAKNIGQFIQEDVRGHLHKRGTPTMGGVVIIFGTLLGYAGSHLRLFTLGDGFDFRVYPFAPEGLLAVLAFVGMGFIGGGAILHAKGTVYGLTSAAALWLVSAVGIAVGLGEISIALLVTFLSLVVLTVIRAAERSKRPPSDS